MDGDPVSYADRVRSGVVLLDEKDPGWWRLVDVACLDMNNCRQCVLGQVFGSYLGGAERLRIHPDFYGFDIDIPHKLAPNQVEDLHYYTLTRLWTYVIRSRQEQEAEQAGKQGRVRGLRLPEEDQRRVEGLLLPVPVLRRDGESDPGPADVRAVQHGTTHVGGVS